MGGIIWHDDLAQDFMVEMAAILHGKDHLHSRLEKKRAMFLEGYIRFAEIFAQSEIGDMEVDITKLALYIYSPNFNIIWHMKSIQWTTFIK